MPKPYRVFYSYSHKDEAFLNELKEHLAPLRHGKLIEDWYDRMIPSGRTWAPQIAAEMEKADIFLMLISASFLNSDYCFNIEMNKAIERAKEDEVYAIPIIIRECLWNFTPLQELKALPIDGIPINSWPDRDRDKAWKNVAEGLLNTITGVTATLGEKSVSTAIIQNLEVTERPEPLVFGRENEIQSLIEKLIESHNPVTITSGFGGIGKSTLALKIAWHFYKNKAPFNFIAFVNCRSYGTDEKQGVDYNYILNEIARAAEREDIASNTNLEAKEQLLRELLRIYRTLLILDNYESLLQHPEEEKKVSKFINSLPTGSVQSDFLVRVTVTTRELSAGLKAPPRNELEVE